jgi:hypothetical protein
MTTADLVHHSIGALEEEKGPYESLAGTNVEWAKDVHPVVAFCSRTPSFGEFV